MEIMVAMGLVAVLASVMLSMFEAQNKALAQVEERLEQSDVLQEIKGLLRDAPTCAETFQAKNAISLPEGEVKSLRIPDSGHVRQMYSTESDFGKRVGILGYRLESKELSETESADVPGFFPGHTNGYATLYIRFARKNGAPLSKKVRLRVQTESATDRKITLCQAVGGVG